MMITKRKFIVFLCLWGVAVPLGLILFNYHQDPGGRYCYRASAADLVVLAGSGDHFLSVPENYDDRALLAQYIDRIAPPSLVLMGGSRVLNITSAMLKKTHQGHFLNTGVTSGTYQDYVALWSLLKKKGKIPKAVVVCLDLQALSALSQNELWKPLADSHLAVLNQAKDLTAYQTTLRSLKMLGRHGATFKIMRAGEYDRLGPARDRSFSLYYPLSYESRPSEVVAEAGRSNGEGETKAFRSWSAEDRQAFVRLGQMLTDMGREGVQAHLVIMPYHPDAMKKIEADPVAARRMEAFREAVERLAADHGISCYDGYKDSEYALLNSDFSDGVHLKASSNHAFFKRADQSLHMDLFD